MIIGYFFMTSDFKTYILNILKLLVCFDTDLAALRRLNILQDCAHFKRQHPKNVDKWPTIYRG